ncbi:hypothetical protein D9611_013926 [Ephemerocybe angulata]|uniref:Pantoate--beta-alanine ligase n=1 Tax=Ephemerocybe angulata TaxID=980116 RepID=A0A8H5B8V8_9AGAR|nr:hypothetical protein D9611_013926 [Tulosesus angulatus]
MATTSSNSTSHLPESKIPIFTTVASYREWREKALRNGQSVGFVPTMGALHEGHLSLVRRSLSENDLTVVSIFVNPAQFAPHEDLSSYPRTLPGDLKLLEEQNAQSSIEGPNSCEVRYPAVVFVPSVQEMYPSGIVQNVSEQKGTFIEVKGFSHQMEGQTRPTFFRGVATVVTKLFNVIQPTNAYFGQKDIQQALLLKRMVTDLLMAYPTPQNLHIIPTTRDPTTGLALSSRNLYLTTAGRQVAPTLRQALVAAAEAWSEGYTKEESIAKAKAVVEENRKEASEKALEVELQLDYIEMNDSKTFDVLDPEAKESKGNVVILSGALYVDKTRLIDNILLGNTTGILG